MRTIGVVGGVGPLAGIDFQTKIISQTKAEQDQDHLDVLSVSFPSRIPDRTAFLLNEEPKHPAEPIADQLYILDKAGAEVGAIPCNTAHAPRIFNEIRRILVKRGVSIRLLNMIEEVCDFFGARFSKGASIGVLCTLGTYRTKIYEDALQARGFGALSPSESGQRAVHDAIYSRDYGVKSVGANDKALEQVRAVVRKLKAGGAQAVILGCTELPVLVKGTAIEGIPTVDPTLLLARAAVREAAPDKLVPWEEGQARDQ